MNRFFRSALFPLIIIAALVWLALQTLGSHGPKAVKETTADVYKQVQSGQVDPTQPVTIEIYRVTRTCEAEACKFIDKSAKGRSLTFKIKEFKSITTSKDGSYSTISAVAMSGRPFTLRAIWWTEDPKGFRFSCEKWIKGWLDTRAPPDRYSPYIFDGEVIGDDNHLVLRHVDSCVPHAPNFGALHVFQ